MLRSTLGKVAGKVARKTPGLRRVREKLRGEPDAPPAPEAPPAFGAEEPAAAAPAAVAPAAKAPAAKAPAAKAPAAAESSSSDDEERQLEGGRDADEVERLRQEAERKKAEIRARKEREAKGKAAAQPTTSAAGGIAALIAQTGGSLDDVVQNTDVRATSGVDFQEEGGIHVAPDGTEYWGAIDNDSARARARGDALIIDQWECINCGTCVENTEQVFGLPDDAKAVVLAQEGPMDLIQDAIDACPVTCIHWTDDPEQFEQLNDEEGNPL